MEKPRCKAELLFPLLLTRAQPQFLRALWSAASHLITLPQLLDLIRNVLQEKFGLPVGSAVAYLHMVISTSVCCCRYQIAKGHGWLS